MQFIDLSQPISPDMPRFSPTWPAPKVTAWLSHADSATTGAYVDCTCEISRVDFLTSIGTYLDSPYHFNPDGAAIHELTLAQLVLPGVVVDCSDAGEITPIEADVLDGVDIRGKAVLFRTGWSRFWGEERYFRFPFLARSVAQALCAGGAKLAGVDFLAADDVRDPQRPAHVTLLHSDVLIVENLTNLAALPADGFTFHAVPAKIARAAAFPIRAYAVVN